MNYRHYLYFQQLSRKIIIYSDFSSSPTVGGYFGNLLNVTVLKTCLGCTVDLVSSSSTWVGLLSLKINLILSIFGKIYFEIVETSTLWALK